VPGIFDDNIEQFQNRVISFDQAYVNHWNQWLVTPQPERPNQLGVILRKWQACRPNRMRRTQEENIHSPPYLEDLVTQATPHLQTAMTFDIRLIASFTREVFSALRALWDIFEQLSYHGRARGGIAGVVGISKAVLLLSDGKIGPAFDSEVRGHLNIKTIDSANQWIQALKIVNRDIEAFERSNNTTLQNALPQYAHLNSGRIYDMALGPRRGTDLQDKGPLMTQSGPVPFILDGTICSTTAK